MMQAECPNRTRVLVHPLSATWLVSRFGIRFRERGMSSKRESTLHVYYVPVRCTHRPSLLPMVMLVRFLRALLFLLISIHED